MKVDGQSVSVSKLLSSGSFTIPEYQREYDWEDEQINELKEDIFEIGNDESYFIGHMVFEGKKNGNSFIVIDGQQRLTTIIIMLCCLRDLFYELNADDSGDGINDNYIFYRDVEYKKHARLINDMPYPVLQARVINIPSERNNSVQPHKNGEKKIISAYENIYSSFKDKSIEELKQLRDKILNLETVSVFAEGVSNACTIFMTLNSTGKDLTPLDLVKSLIFSKYKKVPLINEPNDTWKTICNNIKHNPKFLNQFFASRYKKVADRKLFKEIEKAMKTLVPGDSSESAKKFLQQMLNDSENYKKINEPSPEQWEKSEYDIYESIYAITKQFKIQVSKSFLLAIIRDYKSKQISKTYCLKALKSMERFHFINNAVCSNRSSGLDQLYAKFAHDLFQAPTRQEKHKVINQVCLDLKQRIASKSDFEANIDNKLYYTKHDEKQKELVKYVLIKLERKRNSHSIPIATSIEHIYPETPKTMSLSDPNLIRNIGNLVLLEDDINSKIGNKEYADKKTYVISNSKINTAIEVFRKYNSWSDDEIKERRTNMITEIYDTMWK